MLGKPSTPGSRNSDDSDAVPRSPLAQRFKQQRPNSAVVKRQTIPGVSSTGLNAYGVPVGSKLSQSNSQKDFTDSVAANDASLAKPANVDPAERIRVCVRKRPLSSKEMQRNEKDMAEVLSRQTIVLNEPKYVYFNILFYLGYFDFNDNAGIF